MKKIHSDLSINDFGFSVQERLQAVDKKYCQLNIGIPKENLSSDYRIPLTPQAVSILTSKKHHVIIEKGLGAESNFSDKEFVEAGANIASRKQEVLHADIIIKMLPPTTKEVLMMKSKSTIISSIQYAQPDGSYIESMKKKKITAIGFEHIQDQYGDRPLLQSIGEIAGRCAVLLGANLLMSAQNQKGMLLGGVTSVPKTNVLIFGAGAVGTSATLASIGLGCSVSVLDDNIHKLHRLSQQMNGAVSTGILQNDIIKQQLSNADLVIGSVRHSEDSSEFLITKEMSLLLKPKSVVVDLSIDKGGIFPVSRVTSLENPTFINNNVIYCCLPNITSIVANTTSMAISNVLLPLCLEIAEAGGVEDIIWVNEWFKKGVYTYNGHVTNYTTAKKYRKKYVDITLLKWSNV